MEFESIKQNLVGKKYEKFSKKNFSFLAFLFGGLYYVYRKMYVEGIIFYLINIQLSTLTLYTGENKFTLAALLFSLTFGLLFGGLYRTYINKKANLLATKQPVLESDYKKHGRTSFLAVILVMIVVSAIQTNVINKYLYEPLFGNPILNFIKQSISSIDGVNPDVLNVLNQINSINDLKKLEPFISNSVSNEPLDSTQEDSTDDLDLEKNKIENETENVIDDSTDIDSPVQNEIERPIIYSDNWSGPYSLDENSSILISRSDINQYNVNINYLEPDTLTMNSNSLTMDYIDNNTLQSDSIFYGGTNITISRTQNGIKITSAPGTDDDIWTMHLDKEFTKNEFEKTDWNGVYRYADYLIILSEVDKDNLHFNLSKDNSSVSLGFDEYTNSEINFENTKFKKTITVNITKTDNGITINSSSTDEDNILNKVSGKEFKKLEEQN